VSRVVSCGVVLVNRHAEVFVCHATGTPRWDLPKGVADAGEPPRATAVREAWEESGLRLEAEPLVDLGEFSYLHGKRLHLFALRVGVDAIDLAACRCRSFHPHHATGRRTPETDAWGWKPRGAALQWSGKNMARVLASLDWAGIDALPEVATIAVDTATP
jgi:putative (di)nucleoside polyphosphate hydrolase